MADDLVIAGKTFNSRLIVGTGRYRTMEDMVQAIEPSGTELVTVAMRRLDSELLGKIANVLAGREGWSLFIKTEEELRQYPTSGRLQFRYGMTLVHGDFEPPPVARAEVLADIRHLANEIEHEARYRLVHKSDTRQASTDQGRLRSKRACSKAWATSPAPAVARITTLVPIRSCSGGAPAADSRASTSAGSGS